MNAPTNTIAFSFNGENIEAQPLCSELGLLPGWSLPAS